MSPREDVGPILNGLPTHLPDIDPSETQEWLDSLDSVIHGPGRMRARYLMLRLLERARAMQVGVPSLTTTDYVNTISPEQEPWFPGDEDVERRFRAYLRWNAAMIVHRAQRPGIGVGGHISTYASAATLYEVGMNHFFRGKDHPGGGDQVFFQGHASPGMYARAYLEGRISAHRLDGFRQEKSHIVDGKPLALPSYPHPRLMPDFWEFPTVSMGIGPMNAIYQAQFNKYLHARGMKDTSDQHVWSFLGDGEMDEPESRGLLQLAGNEELDNLTFVINCNLQRLDRDPRTRKMVADWSDEDIWWKLKRGGHDFHKVYAAYKAALNHTGQPTVILAKTIKGYGLGQSFAGRNATHQMKKFTLADLKGFRDSLNLPITDEQLEKDPYNAPYYHPGADDDVIKYALERRAKLGGGLPKRQVKHAPVHLPDDSAYAQVKKGSGKQQIATTMGFVRLLKDLMRDKEFGKRVVPIIPDEARTFGMDSFFPTIKIYNPHGQRYTPVDAELMLAYRESTEGHILHLGINEAGSVAAFTATGTSYATHGEPMIPIYVFYSMFGFQRTGDSIWAAADQMTRGFLIGATAGRTTLTGEGLQHADGHSPLLASTNPGVVHYDPAFAYEIAHIMQDGLHRMYGTDESLTDNDRNVIYYITVYNEPNVQPVEPEGLDREGLLKGLYLYAEGSTEGLPADAPRVQLLASGVGMAWALEAQELLRNDWHVVADVWSVTSWNELRRDGLRCDETAFLHPEVEAPVPWVTQKLGATQGPVIAVSDYMRAVQDQIAQWVPGDFASLGADGFGFSDTRPAARRFFHIDGPSMAVRALQSLAERGEVERSVPLEAARRYRLGDVTAGSSGNEGGDS